MRVTIPIDLSTRPFIPLPHFFNSRRTPPLLNPTLVLFPQQSARAAHDVRSFWKLYRLTVHHSDEQITWIQCIQVGREFCVAASELLHSTDDSTPVNRRSYVTRQYDDAKTLLWKGSHRSVCCGMPGHNSLHYISTGKPRDTRMR